MLAGKLGQVSNFDFEVGILVISATAENTMDSWRRGWDSPSLFS